MGAGNYKHEIRNINELIPYVNNSRTHSDEQVNQIASSMKEWAIVNESFAVSSCGVIISLPRKCKTKGGGYRSVRAKVISQYYDKDGYKLATCRGLSKNGQVRVHKLVAECFIGECPEGFEVNHDDGDKENNNVSNLEYMTSKNNSIHAVDAGLIGTGLNHHNTKPVVIKKDGFGYIAFGCKQIRKLGFREQSIHRVANGGRKLYRGWECHYV